MKFIGRKDGISTYKTGPYYIHAKNKSEVMLKLKKKKKNNLFYLSFTYSEITPESAANGDYSDTGYKDYGYFASLEDVLNEVNDHSTEHIQLHGTSLDVYGEFYVDNYKTGTERQICLHINGPEKAIQRLYSILRKKETV